jgi:predicted dehydrogenase
MRVLWHDRWLNAPGYGVIEGSRRIAVEGTVSLVALGDASGRVLRRRRTKFVRFLLTDGPRSTLRKVRSKLAEQRYTGDYRVVAIVGNDVGTGERVAGIACRVPPCATEMLLHPRLIHLVDDSFELPRFAIALARHETVLRKHGRQSWLYSGMEPPSELRSLTECSWREPASEGETSCVLRPPTAQASTENVMRLRPPAGGRQAAVLGAGDYARTEVVPALRSADLELAVLCDREPQIASQVAQELGFAAATADPYAAIELLPPESLVVVATAHDSHALLAATALEAGHFVFLEKPAVVTEEDLKRLVHAVRTRQRFFALGYNRRYHPLVRRARAVLSREDGPATMTCTVREIELEPDHWYLWPNQGTRVTGNLCHWLDLGLFLTGGAAAPVHVAVSPFADDARLDEERTLTVTFDDGSVFSVLATGRGDPVRGVQEQIEVHRGITTLRLDDLWRLTVLRNGRSRTRRTVFRGKAHQRMFRETLVGLHRGYFPGYPLRDLVVGSLIQIAASELARGDGGAIDLTEQVTRWLTTESV